MTGFEKKSPLRIGMVAGEASGDILGADLIRALKVHFPEARFEGIGGPLMQTQGFHSLAVMDRLSVMGLIEPLKRLPELLGIRKRIIHKFIVDPPAVFIGIDAPDFNLGIEQALRRRGIPTVHYVSPSVWAWRRYRINKIRRAVDLMLTVFPFEAAFYQQQRIPVAFVGHPLADQMPLQSDCHQARAQLGWSQERITLALLPGSRSGEVGLLAKPFIEAALLCRQQQPDLHCVMVAASPQRYRELQQILADLGVPDQTIELVEGESRTVMAAADAALIASGTATLEALLAGLPMVVAYRMAGLSYAIISRLLQVSYVSLPNLLANRALVPELIQDEVTSQRLAELVWERLKDDTHCEQLRQEFQQIHQQLRQGAGDKAASDIVELLEGRQLQEKQ